MAPSRSTPARLVRFLDGALGHPVLAWSAFAIVHALLGGLCFVSANWPLGDVERVYLGWAQGAASGSFVAGITTAFVYPVVAMVPITAALAFGPGWYALSWLAMVTALNAWAFAGLLGPGRRRDALRRDGRRVLAAWWWLAFLLLLGPIALARIDSITVPIAVVALLWLRSRPVWSAALLTIAAWIKVWPAVIVAALVMLSRQGRRVLTVAVGVSGLILAVALALGSGAHVLSFVSGQTGRGVQVEAPVAAVWLWQVALDTPGSSIYYDRDILTFQVAGPGVGAVAAWMTPVMGVVVAVVMGAAFVATRRGAPFDLVFPPLLLALVAGLVAANKVGSPQFATWFAAPVVLGLVVTARRWAVPAGLTLAMAALTHLVYPHLYNLVLEAEPWIVLVLTVRNLIEFVLLGWALHRLWALRIRGAYDLAAEERAALTLKE